MSAENAVRRRGLSRAAVVARALEVGNQEGLDAVSLRRLAADFHVTPMAIYRHVRDKQDLINAMAEDVLEDLDLTAGVRRSMSWTQQIRKAVTNLKEQMEAKPLALPLSIAYSGDGPPSFYRMSEDLLGIALQAGFSRRDAIVLIRVVSNLISGYLLLTRQPEPYLPEKLDPRQVELIRRRFELIQLSLPPERFPNLIANAHDMADVWLSDPDRWWDDTVDLIVFGMEAKLARSRSSRGRTRGASARSTPARRRSPARRGSRPPRA